MTPVPKMGKCLLSKEDMIIKACGHLADAHATTTVKFSTPRTLVSIQASTGCGRSRQVATFTFSRSQTSQNLTDRLLGFPFLTPCPFSLSRKVDRDSKLAFGSSLVLPRSPPLKTILVRTLKLQIRPLVPAPVPPLPSA